jgi:adenylate cyclase
VRAAGRAGIPLFRVAFYIRTLHPDIFGRNFIWKPGEPLHVGTADYSVQDTPQFHASPISIVAREGREIRARVGDPDSARWPIVEDLKAEGVTDYIALPIKYIDGSAHTTSWTTKQAGGFTDEQVAALRSIIAPLSRLVEVVGLRRVATTLLDTYVGNRAGEKIPRRPDQARPCREHERRDLALRPPRLHRAVRPPAAGNRRRYPQQLLSITRSRRSRRMAARC